MNKLVAKQKTNICPVERAMNIIGKRWTALIIRDLVKGTKRFCELERLLKDISPRVLSRRLNELEQTKIIKRKVFVTSPVRVEYSLTKKGQDLTKVIDSMAAWGTKWH